MTGLGPDLRTIRLDIQVNCGDAATGSMEAAALIRSATLKHVRDTGTMTFGTASASVTPIARLVPIAGRNPAANVVMAKNGIESAPVIVIARMTTPIDLDPRVSQPKASEAMAARSHDCAAIDNRSRWADLRSTPQPS